MNKVILMLDYSEGPVWGMRKRAAKVPAVIANDSIVKSINEEMGAIFDSWYNLGSDDSSNIFDYGKRCKDLPKMMELYKELLKRLNELDDGSFVIEDRLESDLSEDD